MLKVRILAMIIAIGLTILTIYLLPKVVYAYTSFMNGLTTDQKTLFSIFQVLLGAALAGYGFWHWKKKNARTKK